MEKARKLRDLPDEELEDLISKKMKKRMRQYIEEFEAEDRIIRSNKFKAKGKKRK
ncbi:MAG: hypothetical protein ACE5K4_07970 [Candidatus Hydrothermarchaeota archaeon]